MKLQRNNIVKYVGTRKLEPHQKVIAKSHLELFHRYKVQEIFYSKAEDGNLVKLKWVFSRNKRGIKVYPWIHEKAFKKVKRAK